MENSCDQKCNTVNIHKDDKETIEESVVYPVAPETPETTYIVDTESVSSEDASEKESESVSSLETDEDDKEENKAPVVYPVVLGSPGTTLSLDNESENLQCQEWDREIAQNNLVVPQSSTINIEDSSDVIIGPLTQFHGPVTIYQNINAAIRASQETVGADSKFNNSAKPSTSESNPSEKQSPLDILLTSYKRLVIYATIAIAMLISIIVGIVVSLNMTSNGGIESENNNGNGNVWTFPNDTLKDNSSIGIHKIYSRNNWGARPSSNCAPLHHPTEYVIIAHTAGRVCKNFYKCSEFLQDIQSLHASNPNYQCKDIGYNFLIGGDGNVYVGRDWDTINFLRNNTISVSFTGNYVFDILTPKMISALKDLLDLGVQQKKLAPDYKLVCHNQTYATVSPGQNIYQEISKFPHFYPEFVTFD